MIPWWSGFFLLIGGILIGAMIVVLDETEDEPRFRKKKE